MSAQVTSRTVTRWYYRGKGYANRLGAYRAKAKDIVRDQVLATCAVTACSECKGTGKAYGDRCYVCDGAGMYIPQHARNAAYEREFPHDEDGACLHSNGGKCADRLEREGDQEWSEGPKYTWCRTKWLARIDALARVLATEAKAASDGEEAGR